MMDAFIFESAKDLKTLITDENIHFVVADNALRNSLSQINGATVHKDLDEFVQCEDVENLARQNEFEKHWNEIYETILPTIEDAFTAAIQAITYELTWKELHHPNIPEDNNEAVISVLEEPDGIDFMWEDVKNYGSGLITIPFEFETISEIQFKVYRGDAFDLDDKIYVEYKDPEANHYFDASGTVKIEVSGTISVQFENGEVEPEGIINLLKEVQFNEIKSIDIVETEDGSIFI
jgi:hypothetical protein